jgi:hypothetical protein
MWLLGSPDTEIVSVCLATDVECGFIREGQFFCETKLPPFSAASPRKIHASSLCLPMLVLLMEVIYEVQP